MSEILRSRYKDGRLYDGHKQFLGNGIKRSCDKCGQHVNSAELRKWRGPLLACQKCREGK